MSSDKVYGYCPMGCGSTLFLGLRGHITCGFLECPNPTAVVDILADRETEHIVQFNDVDFSIQHPLKERVNAELLNCTLHRFLVGLGGPPVRPGRYRATPTKGPEPWSWQELHDFESKVAN